MSSPIRDLRRRRDAFLYRVRLSFMTSRPEPNHGRRKRARVAASDDAVLALRECRAGDSGMPAECAVCLLDFAAEDRLRAMPCAHAFHHDCIFRWLQVNHTCPLCRHALPTEQQGEGEDDDEDAGYGEEEEDDDDEDFRLTGYENEQGSYDYFDNSGDYELERDEEGRLVAVLRSG